MESIVEYRAKKLPFVMEMPIVRKRLSDKSDRNYNDKAEFVTFVDTIKPSIRVKGYVGITCSCGAEYDYATRNDVPSTNVVCPCGRDVLIYGN